MKKLFSSFLGIALVSNFAHSSTQLTTSCVEVVIPDSEFQGIHNYDFDIVTDYDGNSYPLNPAGMTTKIKSGSVRSVVSCQAISRVNNCQSIFDYEVSLNVSPLKKHLISSGVDVNFLKTSFVVDSNLVDEPGRKSAVFKQRNTIRTSEHQGVKDYPTAAIIRQAAAYTNQVVSFRFSILGRSTLMANGSPSQNTAPIFTFNNYLEDTVIEVCFKYFDNQLLQSLR